MSEPPATGARAFHIKPLIPPKPPLADETIRLEPLEQSHLPDLLDLVGDEAAQRFTLVPTGAGAEFVRRWIGRYEGGWDDGSCAGFAIRGVNDDAFLGFAALVQLDLDARQGEIGYALPAAVRGRGTAGRAVALLTRWGFDELELLRLELRIDVENTASERVGERSGYRREGVLRNVHFKEGRRSDLGVWSRLSQD